MRNHEVTILRPVVSSDVQPGRQAPKPEPTAIKTNTDNSGIDGFIKALQEGSNIDEAAKQFRLTEDEARVAMVCYRTAIGFEEKSAPIF